MSENENREFKWGGWTMPYEYLLAEVTEVTEMHDGMSYMIANIEKRLAEFETAVKNPTPKDTVRSMDIRATKIDRLLGTLRDLKAEGASKAAYDFAMRLTHANLSRSIRYGNPQGRAESVEVTEAVSANKAFRLNRVKEETEISEQFKAGDKVKVPHKGKVVSGKIVRFDDGGTSKAQQHGGGYVVDVGEPASILVPKQKVQKEEMEVAEARYGYGSKATDIVGYTWDADAHTPEETRKALKAGVLKATDPKARMDQHKIPDGGVEDREGNEIHPVFAHDPNAKEWFGENAAPAAVGQATFKQGDILVCKWGATMRLVDFYKVVSVSGDWVILAQLGDKKVTGDGFIGTTVASSTVVGSNFRKKMKRGKDYRGNEHISVIINSSSRQYGQLWDGRPVSYDHLD